MENSVNKEILIDVSARHIHLDKITFEALFGKGSEPTIKRELQVPGGFLCNERADIIGPKGSLTNVSILAPLLDKPQIEISISDSHIIGVMVEVKESGDIEGSTPIILRNKEKEVHLSQGLIAAKRHIHMNPENAVLFGVKHREMVNVAVNSERPIVFCKTMVRIDPSYVLSIMHIDTDEANAAMITKNKIYGKIINIDFAV